MEGLLPIDFDVSNVAEPGEVIQNLPIGDVQPNTNQPRRIFKETLIDELSVSIKEYGILQPLIVSPLKDDKYQIVAGERRWRAAQKAGLKTVPAIVRDHQERQKLEIAIVENVQRVGLTPMEQARSMYRLRQEFNMSLPEISKKVGKAQPTISNIMRLLQLPEEAQKALQSGQISEGHARAILSVPELEQQLQLLKKIITQKISVREAEHAATMFKKGLIKVGKKIPDKPKIVLNKELKKMIKETAATYKVPVAFNLNTRELRVRVETAEQLKEVLKALEKKK